MDAVAAPRPLLQGLIPPEDDPEVAALPISCRSASGDDGVLLAQRQMSASVEPECAQRLDSPIRSSWARYQR